MSLMKTRQIMVLTVLLGLWAAPDGLTFYNPETGRWPNRDPIRELGFEALRAHYARKGKPTRGDGDNLYKFVENNPISKWDYLGLAGC